MLGGVVDLNKLTSAFVIFALLSCLFGCAKNEGNIDIFPNDTEKIMIFRYYKYDYKNISKPDDFLLVNITDSKGIQKFLNMINNAKKEPGIFCMTPPPYLAEIHSQDKVYKIDLYIGEDNKDGIYVIGGYLGYCKIRKKDSEAFLKVYGESL